MTPCDRSADLFVQVYSFGYCVLRSKSQNLNCLLLVLIHQVRPTTCYAPSLKTCKLS